LSIKNSVHRLGFFPASRRHGEEQNKNLETQRNGGSGGKEFSSLIKADDTDSGSGDLVIR
jgi:hypothetical protein